MASIRRGLFAAAVTAGVVAAPTTAHAGASPEEEAFDSIEGQLENCTGTSGSPTTITMSENAVNLNGDIAVKANCHVILNTNGKELKSRFIELQTGAHLTLQNSNPSLGGVWVLNGDKETAGGDEYRAAIEVPKNTTLTIQSGKVTAYSVYGIHGAPSSGSPTGAAIGADNEGTGGTINISGGVVEAVTNNGAGIGGAYNDTEGGTITITGGEIAATSLSRGAGIGAGNWGAKWDIAISGANTEIEAHGGYGSAGIGSAWGSGDGSITINNGAVFAVGGNGGAGIGGAFEAGYLGEMEAAGPNFAGGGTIEINGGDIEAWAGEEEYYGGGAGIGRSYDSFGDWEIKIHDGTIKAYGAWGGAGIGGAGYTDRLGEDTIVIDGGTIVHAFGGGYEPLEDEADVYPCTDDQNGVECELGANGAGIGGGFGSEEIDIAISDDAEIHWAQGGLGAAGIGGGAGVDDFPTSSVIVDIRGTAKIDRASGGSYAAGIGGGRYNRDVDVTIAGSAVIGLADSPGLGAGIGGGSQNGKGDGGDVTVSISGTPTITKASGGTVTGAAIGSGEYTSALSVTISGGTFGELRGAPGFWDEEDPNNSNDGYWYHGGPAVGGGYETDATTITISGGTFGVITGGDFSAVIGSGSYTGTTDVTISGGVALTTQAGAGGTGIGGGSESDEVNVTISGTGTAVTANAGADPSNEDFGDYDSAGVAIGSTGFTIGNIIFGQGTVVTATGYNAVGFGQYHLADGVWTGVFTVNGELRIPDEDGRLALPTDYTSMTIGTTGKIIGSTLTPRVGAALEGNGATFINNQGVIALNPAYVDIAIKGNHFEVSFDGNGADSGVPEDSEIVYGPSFSAGYRDLPDADDVTRDGYEFLGWERVNVAPSFLSLASANLPFDDDTDFGGASTDGEPDPVSLVAVWGVPGEDGDGDGSGLPGTGSTIALLLLMAALGAAAAGTTAVRKRMTE